jgi:ribosome-associated protein
MTFPSTQFIKLLMRELSFSVSRSSGPGGQNVNKVNSKVTIKFDVMNSNVLTAEEKEVLLKKLAVKLTVDGVLILTAQDSREKRKARKPTKPSKGSVQKRIKSKKQHSEKKQWRQKL